MTTEQAPCRICTRVPAEFADARLCAECRMRIAQLILHADADLVSRIWRTTQQFASYRLENGAVWTAPLNPGTRPERRAGVDQGLLELGRNDEALMAAASAILHGTTADINSVGARALRVPLSPQLLRPDGLHTLMLHLSMNP